MAIFKSILPPMMPTVDNILGAMVSDRCDILFCVPSIVEVSLTENYDPWTMILKILHVTRTVLVIPQIWKY